MGFPVSDYVADAIDLGLIAALQCDGRITAERAAEVLGLPARVVTRRWAALLDGGGVRVVASPPLPRPDGVMLLRIRVLRGKVDAVAHALAARSDIPLVDVSAGGDQLIAVLTASPDHRDRLVFRQLPTTSAVTSVEAETVIHVFAVAGDWRLDALTPDERDRLTPRLPAAEGGDREADEVDRAVAAALAGNARMSASAVARATGHPESTVRRRLTALFEQGQLRTQVLVDPRRLGLGVDANLRMRVPPARLDRTGRLLAAHPAVHGALATTGPGNLNIAVWLRDLDHLYRFITHDLAALDVDLVDTVLVGQALKRPDPAW
ncbi:Lrp/AsnC family transcriptional regulator [Streptacidiphilus sp. N1-12]|uniref:Lrp/AsnC family transcriptional regulator n=2 Tax=Streptacidiphilus alkalitolerans TaxID=3342712 RepID=A0ABV6WHL8_9ACTN